MLNYRISDRQGFRKWRHKRRDGKQHHQQTGCDWQHYHRATYGEEKATSKCGRGSITYKTYKNCMTTTGGTFGKIKINLKLHKTGVPLYTIASIQLKRGRNSVVRACKVSSVVHTEHDGFTTWISSSVSRNLFRKNVYYSGWILNLYIWVCLDRKPLD